MDSLLVADNIQSAFKEKVLNDLLIQYCMDPKRNYSTEGFKIASLKISNEDAYHFLRAMENSIVTDIGGCRYVMPKSKAFELIFWEGSKLKSPRDITLWHEPVITIGAASRLNLDYGWPKELLGMQSKDGAFDLVAYVSKETDHLYIAGEVKKTTKEIDDLLSHLFHFDASLNYDYSQMNHRVINSHKKWLSLNQSKAPYFWAIGPGNDTRLFQVSYKLNGNIDFKSCSLDFLSFNSSGLHFN